MAGRRQQVENPWSGFVDVLSNVVMVVTFLVIILGIAMFALSQQVAKSMAAELMRSEESRQQVQMQINAERDEESETMAGGGAAGMAEIEALREGFEKDLAAAIAERNRARKNMESMQKELTELRTARAQSAGQNGSEGVNRVSVDRPLLQADEVEGNTDLTIRSRRIEKTVQTIVASAEEVAEDKTGTKRVESSDAMLKVTYEPSLYKIDSETTEKLRAFFEENAETLDGPIELRTFASSGIGSVSEARRIAFYRAMTVRSAAVAAGIDPKRVKVALREAEREEDADTVVIFTKPEDAAR